MHVKGCVVFFALAPETITNTGKEEIITDRQEGGD